MALRSRVGHDPDCSDRGCMSSCDLRQFDEGLLAPLLPWEVREAARVAANWERLRAGEIPGRPVPAAAEPPPEVPGASGDPTSQAG